MTTTLSVVVEVPSALMGSRSEAELSADVRTTLAIRLFEERRVSTGRAAQMANMTRIEFIQELGRRKVPVVDWDEAEIQRELGYAHEGSTARRG